jgi:hypothetical protein
MLFAYQYVTHQIDKMQSFIDYIFNDVWCNASTLGGYNLEAFDGYSELKELITELSYEDTKAAYYFVSHIQSIYDEFAKLSAPQTAQLKSWYAANNDIENICFNNPTNQIVKYADIASSYPKLAELFSTFFKNLYDHLGVAAVRERVGDIIDHYNDFMQHNIVGKCPFCGISDVLGINNSKREAYDHYLPKGLYPFNSVNFKNLVPACHTCNSSYKNIDDPAHIKDPSTKNLVRRKIFYPFSTNQYQLSFEITLNNLDIQKLTPADIQLNTGPIALKDEIDTWLDVYGIEERYKAKLCGENDGKYWYVQIMDEYQNDNQTPKDLLEKIRRQSEKKPFAESNFLKVAFLDACDKKGLLG